jgi:hypothetical protein
VKSQVVMGASVYPSRWSRMECTDRRELYPFRDLGYREIGKEDSRVSTRELARLQVATSTFWG